MLDNKALAKLVDEEIKRTVQSEVSSALNNTDWLDGLELKIVSHVQDRITARFSNINTIPDLVKTVESSVNKMFVDGFVPSIDHMVDTTLLTQAVDQAVENLVSGTVESLLEDQSWLLKIQNQIARETADRINRSMKQKDVVDKIRDVLIENKDLLAGDLNRELEFANGIVVVKGHIDATTIGTSSGADIGGDSKIHGSLIVDGDLAIKGRIATDNRAFRELGTAIKEQALDELKSGFVDTVTNSVTEKIAKGINVENVRINGSPLVLGDRLGSGIKHSSLESVGILKDLSVGSVLTANNTRVGINTNSPTSALSVWDNEVTIDIGKRSLNTAQIGTSKAQDLSIVTNNKEQIKIDKDGVTWINKLKVGHNSISHDTSTPGYQGAKGDIVFNTAYVPGGTFAWVCLGSYRWHELKSA